MNWIDVLIIMAITNLIVEQKIVRDRIVAIFDPEDYDNWKPIKRFFWDLLSCPSCAGFHIAWIYMIFQQVPIGIQYAAVPLIVMFLMDLIKKLQR